MPARHRVTLVPGDGIGPEVIGAARRVLDASGAGIDWDVQPAGAAAAEREGAPLPERTLDSIRRCGAALKGPTATPVGRGFRSVNLALRRELDLYAGVRPARAYAGVAGATPGTDLVVVRMNHEDLYAGVEYGAGDAGAAAIRRLVRESRDVEIGEDSGVSLKYLSSSQAERLVRRAFEHARATGRARLTAVHKASVMRETDGLFLAAARRVAGELPELDFDDALVDTVCGELVRRPAAYDVLVLPALYGDIVSDIAAALAGGLGMAPGASLGPRHAVFEAVHGSAPRQAGRNRANPFAAILSGAMLLHHLGERAAAQRVEEAVAEAILEGDRLTYDVAPPGREAASTSEVAEAVAARLGAPASRPGRSA